VAQTIVVVTTIIAASSQKMWLSPESLTALIAADRGFAGFGSREGDGRWLALAVGDTDGVPCLLALAFGEERWR
jgi:hypothetical protein